MSPVSPASPASQASLVSLAVPRFPHWRRNLATAVSLLLIIPALFLAACGSGTQGSSTKHTLTAICSVGGSYTQDMSPFSPNVNCGVEGLVYENLVFVNDTSGKETPMLATGYQWSADNLTLTFTTRTGVKWSDGKSFDANDVAFTFNMLKQYPGADGNGLWQFLSSVTASNPTTVVMTFAKPAPTILPYIEQVYIVPQHIWSSVGDPTKYTNTSPVGTGPMKLKSFSSQIIKYVKNPTYWQADKVKVDELDYPVVSSNNTALEEMEAGQADWTAIFDPAVNAFVQKDPAHNFSNPVPVVPVMIVPNLTDPLLSQLPVRQAISAALDRNQMGTSGEAGMEKAVSSSGLIPGQEPYLDPKYNGTLPQFSAPSATQADQILQQAGFTKGSDGIYADAHGHKLSFAVTVPGDYSDYVADLGIAQQNLQAAGIGLTLNKVSDTDFHTDRAEGHFQLLMSGGFFGPSPYYYFEPLLISTGIGGPNGTNWEQYKNPQVDQLLNQYAATTDASAQHQIIAQLSDIMVNDLPVIPVLGAVQFAEYTTTHWTGWPTPSDPYAIGSAYSLSAGDNEQVILHLTPVS